MKSYIKNILMTSATALLFACNSNDDFTPGPEPTNTGGQSVYFSSDYDALYIYSEQPKNDTIEIAVHRKDSTNALTMPIIVNADTSIHVNDKAVFKAGSSTTYIHITSPYVTYTKETDFTLQIPDEYANPYEQKEGTTILKSGILWSQWDVVADTVLFYSDFPTQGCKIENLRGMNRFRFTDFLGSGTPLEFSVKCDKVFDSSDFRQNAGEINPLSNYYYGTNGYWYFTNGGDYTPWYPKGSDTEISWISFWPERTYTYIDFQISNPDTLKIKGKKYLNDYNNHYSCMTSWIKYSKGNAGYVYFYMQVGYLIKDDEK